MKLPSRRTWLILTLLLAPLAWASDKAYRRYVWWDNFERIIVYDSWTVALPQGGSVTYRNQAPRMRPIIGPADTQKILQWTKPDGQSNDYPISFGGGGYHDIELRMRADGKALWLISWDWREVVATLDLQTGTFTGEGVVYHWGVEGQDESAPSGTPAWANLKRGRSLGRKKF
ncbi:hypothetical protein IAD21_00371 [Abditibacteriota bacterium]|nr:hypothetical protein IAD21_00371 [Abditibacteriota bacterium]